MDENVIVFRDIDQSPGIIFDDDDHLNKLRNKLLNIKVEDDSPTPREDLLDLED